MHDIYYANGTVFDTIYNQQKKMTGVQCDNYYMPYHQRYTRRVIP